MPYIGNSVQNQGFAPAIDYFNGNGVTVTFTLSRPLASVAQIICAIDNVIQNPSSAFTVSGNSITFTSAPLSGTNNIWVEYTSLITTYQGISQDPSVIGDITASGGYLSTGDFGNSFIDGTLVDYVTGAGRITVGELDDLIFYHGGTAGRSEIMRLSYANNSYIVGNLGIGTTSSSYNLSVIGNANADQGIKVQNTNSGGTAYSEIWIGSNTNANQTAIFVPSSGNSNWGGAGSLNLYTATATPITFNTNATERMRISGSGYVTTPYQPMFNAYPSAGGSVANATVLPFNATNVNVGTCFNTSTYRFTAPIAGTYYFVAQPSFLSPSNTRIGLRVNANYVFIHEQAPVTGWQTINISFISTLAANDYVDVYNASGSTYSLDPGIYSAFMGYLIG
jgi:hypothetical protein